MNPGFLAPLLLFVGIVVLVLGLLTARSRDALLVNVLHSVAWFLGAAVVQLVWGS